MVALSEVKRWRPGVLDEVARTLRQRLQVLVNSGDDFGKVVPVPQWAGPASENATGEHKALMGRLDRLVAGATVVHKALAQAADAIPPVQTAIHAAEELARKYGYVVSERGEVIDDLAGAPPADLHPDDRLRAYQQVMDEIRQALRTAADIDTDLSRVLRSAGHGGFGTGDESTVASAAAAGAKDPGLTLIEPPFGTPSQNAAWWATLSPSGRQILLRDHPDWLGNMDGLPGKVRSAANVARLPKERAALEQQRTYAQSMVEQAKAAAGYDPSGGLMKQALGQLQAIDDKLHSLDAIEQTMAAGDRQLLLLDTTHPRVEAAIAVGDIDTAQNVAVFTPGFTSTVDGSLAEYDQNMKDLALMADRLDQRYGTGPTATVTWIGYQAPQWDGVADPDQSVVSPDLAKAGGDSLARFYDGIGAGHDVSGTPLHLTALGHSYGSVTTGYALGHETPVDDAILFGSPGQGAERLNVPQGHVYTEMDRADLVPQLNGPLGPSPYSASNHYGQLSTDASTTALGPMSATAGHGGYLDDRSTSMYNMAAIATGHNDLAVPQSTSHTGGPR